MGRAVDSAVGVCIAAYLAFSNSLSRNSTIGVVVAEHVANIIVGGRDVDVLTDFDGAARLFVLYAACVGLLAGRRRLKKVKVQNKAQIKQMLYAGWVLGVKGDEYRAFGGFQLWWYSKQSDVCNCCESHWSDPRKKVDHYSLDKAAKALWRHRDSLYVRAKRTSEDTGLNVFERLEGARKHPVQ